MRGLFGPRRSATRSSRKQYWPVTSQKAKAGTTQSSPRLSTRPRRLKTKVKSAVAHIANQVFQLYSNFLLEEARQPWSKILAEQIDCSPWKDLRGNIHNTPRSKTWDSFMECVTFHLLMVFCSDAAKAQRYYISNGLKKPHWVLSGSSCSASSR